MNGAKRAFSFLVLNKCKCLRDSRRHQKVFRETCGTPAKAKKFLERLAGLPQTLRRSFWALQRFCKSAFSHFGVCRTSARTLFPILVFAGLLQGRFSPFWSLQKSCKDAFPHFGVCRTSARALFLILAFAELLQGRFSSFWHLPHPPPPYFTDQRRPKGALVQGCRRNPSIFAHIL